MTVAHQIATASGWLTWSVLAVVGLACDRPCETHILQLDYTLKAEVTRGDATESVMLEWHNPGALAEALNERTHALEHASIDDYQMYLFGAGQDSAGDWFGVGVTLRLPVNVGDSLTVTRSSKDYRGERGTAGVALSAWRLRPTSEGDEWYPVAGTLVVREVEPLGFDLDVSFRPEKGSGPSASVRGTANSAVIRDGSCGM